MPLKGNGLLKRVKLHLETFLVMCAVLAILGGMAAKIFNGARIARAAGVATTAVTDSLRRQDSLQAVQIVKMDTTLREIQRGQELTILVLILNQPEMTEGDKRRIVLDYQRGTLKIDTLLWRMLAK